jgi:capsular exopolysaccharide synthesis family protein
MNQNIQRAAVSALATPPMPRPMASPMASSSDAMTPKEIVGILRRHLWMIIIFTVAGTILGVGAHFLLQRIYPRFTTRTQIEVLPPVEGDPMTFNASQPQKDTFYQYRFTKANLIKQQSLMQELIRDEEIRKTNWFKKFAKVDEQGNIVGNVEKATKEAIKDLDKNMIASAPRDFIFIEVGMTCGDAEESADITNKIVKIFMRNQQDLATMSISEELASRIRQRDKLVTDLAAAENALASMREGSPYARLNTSDTTQFRDYMDESIAEIQKNMTNLEGLRANLETNLASLKRRAESVDFDDIVLNQVEQDPIARQIRASIAATEPILAERLTRFGSEHRLVLDIRDSLKRMYDDLAQRQREIGDIIRNSDAQSAQEQINSITEQLKVTDIQLQKGLDEYKKADLLRANYAIQEVKRKELIAQREEMNGYIEKLRTIHNDPLVSKLKLLGNAPVPLEMSFPRLLLFLPGGFILGLLAGLGLAFAIELLNDLMRTPSDVMRHLRVPLLGTICHSDDDKDVENVDMAHVVRQAPYSITSECYRQLRTNLKLSGAAAGERKSLLITSPAAGDGKTSIAVNLASTMLYENKHILLIDANFRRPSSNQLFPRTEMNGSVAEHADFGLSNYLMGQCGDEKDVIRSSGIEGLNVIDSGPLPANPAELLDSPRMQQLLERCKPLYDCIIIDGPAMLVSDAKILAAITDATLVVINAADTHRGAAQRILRELQNAHANTAGIVLMGVKSRKGGYFREAYRSYQDYQRVQLKQQF